MASRDQNPQPEPGEKKQTDDLVAPVQVPVAVVITNPLTLGLDLLQRPASKDPGPDHKDTSDRDNGNATVATANAVCAGTLAPVPEWVPTLDSLVALAATEGGAPATAQHEESQQSPASAPARGAASELAFSAQLKLPVQAAPSGAADQSGPPSPPSGARDNRGQPEAVPHANQSEVSAQAPSQDAASGTSGSPTAAADAASGPAPRPAVLAATGVVRTATADNQHPQENSQNSTPPEPINVAATAAPAAPAGHEGSSVPSQPPANVVPVAPTETAPPPAQAASHEVSLHLGDGNSSVDIRMAERAGEIRVTVHTPDHDLAGSLRADLPDLVGKLRQSGYQAEAWRPAPTAHTDAGRRGGSDTPSSSQQDTASGRRDGRRQQQQQKNQSRWDGEWNASLAPAQESQI